MGGLLILEIITQSRKGPLFNLDFISFSLFLAGYFLLNTLYYLYLSKKKQPSQKGLQFIKILQILIDSLFFTALVYYSGGIANHTHTLYFISLIIASTSLINHFIFTLPLAQYFTPSKRKAEFEDFLKSF